MIDFAFSEISDCELQRILLESVEYSAQISLASIWQEGYNLLALVLWTLRNLGGSKGCSTRRDSHQDAFGLSQVAASLDGIIVLYVEHFVDIFRRIGLWHEAGTDALNLVRTTLLTIENCRCGWLYGDDLHVRVLLLQVFGNTRYGAACSYTCHEDVYLAIGVFPNLRTCSGVMLGWVGRIDKLS